MAGERRGEDSDDFTGWGEESLLELCDFEGHPAVFAAAASLLPSRSLTLRPHHHPRQRKRRVFPICSPLPNLSWQRLPAAAANCCFTPT